VLKPGWILKLWRGTVRLPIAFWGYFVLAEAAMKAIIIACSGRLSVLLPFCFVLYLPYILVATVGVWRSASNSASRVGAVLAKVVVTLNAANEAGLVLYAAHVSATG